MLLQRASSAASGAPSSAYSSMKIDSEVPNTCQASSAVTLQAGDALAVQAVPSPDTKCERCWHWRADVGQDPAHPEICGRCVSNLFGTGEDRRHA